MTTPKNPKDNAWLDDTLQEFADYVADFHKSWTIDGRFSGNLEPFKAKILSHQTQYINSVLEELLGELKGKVEPYSNDGELKILERLYAMFTKSIKEKMQ